MKRLIYALKLVFEQFQLTKTLLNNKKITYTNIFIMILELSYQH